MASTALGRSLTARHRTLQLALRARFVREFLALAETWTGDARSFATLVAATIPLVLLRNRDSGELAARYYAAYRTAELGGAAAAVNVAPSPPPTAGKIAAGMWAAGQNQVRRSLLAGVSARTARDNALVQVSGATSTNVLNGGRDTVLDAVKEDPRAAGWQRVTSSRPCAFCLMLSSRGPVYVSETTAAFKAHAACGCKPEAVFQRGASAWSDQALQHRATYQRAQREAREADELKRGTSNDALNALRRTMSREGLTP